MSYWQKNVNQIITSNGFPLLDHLGKIGHQQMEQQTTELYRDFDQQRKQQQAIEADQQDLKELTELKALEQKIKHRPQQ